MIDRHCLEDSVLPNSMLFPEAKDSVELIELISFEKGCGRWINTAKGCPFSSAGGLVSTEMTVNEARIIELWKRMVPLYNTVV